MLNLRELEEPMQKKLDNYIKNSVQIAVRHAALLDYDARKEMYNNITSTSRDRRRKALSELGIEVQVIDINRYPFTDLKRTLAATLGLEFEKYR